MAKTAALVLVAAALLAALCSAATPIACLYVNANTAANAVLAFQQFPNGSVVASGSFPTGGKGSGTRDDPHSQGAVASDPASQLVAAVDTVSGTVAVFHQTNPLNCSLRLVATHAFAAGQRAVSVDVRGELLMAAGNATLVTASVSGSAITPLSTVALASSGTTSQAAFVGERLAVVTDRQLNALFSVGLAAGTASSSPDEAPSAHPTPFGFAVVPSAGSTSRFVAVTEVNGGAAAGSFLTSYAVSIGSEEGAKPSIKPVATVALGETAACWCDVAPVASGDLVAFTANAGSNTISAVAFDAATGSIAIKKATAAIVSGPFDLTARVKGMLTVISTGDNTLESFTVAATASGALTAVGSPVPIPSSAVGITAICVHPAGCV